MAMKIELQPTTASLKIGIECASENDITFTIKLTGDEPVWLSLQIPIGDGGVLSQAEDANDIVVATPEYDPPPSMLDSTDTAKRWMLGDCDKGVRVNGSTELTVSISNILCRTLARPSEITIIGTTNSSPLDEIKAVLKIEKAKPTEPAKPRPYSIAATCLIGIVAVMLVLMWCARDDVTTTTEGWRGLYPLAKLDSNEKAFPSVIFDAAGRTDDALYAVFVQGGTGGRKAVLSKSADGINDWQIIKDKDAVPDGMESSPGVQLGNRLWLIGGSAVDPARKSNRICYYDLGNTRNGWKDAVVVGFDDGARMGHACVVVNDTTIWVLGGQGKYKCLNDVWSLTIDLGGETVIAQQLTNASDWSPRCMFSAIKFNNMIWVCGGVTSPNGNPLGDLWVTESSNISWKQRPTSGSDSVVANAIGTGAAACGDTLYTLIMNRTGGPDWKLEPAMWTIGKLGITTSSDSWTKSIYTPKFPDGSPSTPHSIVVVGFKNRLYSRRLYRNNMYGKVVASPLYVYVKPYLKRGD